jgi:hypothetical protein
MQYSELKNLTIAKGTRERESSSVGFPKDGVWLILRIIGPGGLPDCSEGNLGNFCLPILRTGEWLKSKQKRSESFAEEDASLKILLRGSEIKFPRQSRK